MPTLTVPSGPECIYEFQPYDSIEPTDGQFPDVTELHVEGGKIAVAQDWPLTDKMQRVSLMSALGASMPEIGQQLDVYAKWHHQHALQRLEAVNQSQEVSRLFEYRLLRVIDPIGLPGMTGRQEAYIREIAAGNSYDKIAANFGTKFDAVRDIAKKVFRKLETSSPPRTVLLGYLGGLLCSHCDEECKPTSIDAFDAMVSPHTIIDSPKESAEPIDYVRWGDGTFSFNLTSPLTPAQQGILAMTAIGMTHPETSAVTGLGLNPIKNQTLATYATLGANNSSHAITRALSTNTLQITREIDPLDISKFERASIGQAANGLTMQETADTLGTTMATIRRGRSEMLQRLGLNSTAAAVMKAYMSGDLEKPEATETYAA